VSKEVFLDQFDENCTLCGTEDERNRGISQSDSRVEKGEGAIAHILGAWGAPLNRNAPPRTENRSTKPTTRDFKITSIDARIDETHQD
jgi:hypothetical protein